MKYNSKTLIFLLLLTLFMCSLAFSEETIVLRGNEPHGVCIESVLKPFLSQSSWISDWDGDPKAYNRLCESMYRTVFDGDEGYSRFNSTHDIIVFNDITSGSYFVEDGEKIGDKVFIVTDLVESNIVCFHLPSDVANESKYDTDLFGNITGYNGEPIRVKTYHLSDLSTSGVDAKYPGSIAFAPKASKLLLVTKRPVSILAYNVNRPSSSVELLEFDDTYGAEFTNPTTLESITLKLPSHIEFFDNHTPSDLTDDYLFLTDKFGPKLVQLKFQVTGGEYSGLELERVIELPENCRRDIRGVAISKGSTTTPSYLAVVHDNKYVSYYEISTTGTITYKRSKSFAGRVGDFFDIEGINDYGFIISDYRYNTVYRLYATGTTYPYQSEELVAASGGLNKPRGLCAGYDIDRATGECTYTNELFGVERWSEYTGIFKIKPGLDLIESNSGAFNINMGLDRAYPYPFPSMMPVFAFEYRVNSPCSVAVSLLDDSKNLIGYFGTRAFTESKTRMVDEASLHHEFANNIRHYRLLFTCDGYEDEFGESIPKDDDQFPLLQEITDAGFDWGSDNIDDMEDYVVTEYSCPKYDTIVWTYPDNPYMNSHGDPTDFITGAYDYETSLPGPWTEGGYVPEKSYIRFEVKSIARDIGASLIDDESQPEQEFVKIFEVNQDWGMVPDVHPFFDEEALGYRKEELLKPVVLVRDISNNRFARRATERSDNLFCINERVQFEAKIHDSNEPFTVVDDFDFDPSIVTWHSPLTEEFDLCPIHWNTDIYKSFLRGSWPHTISIPFTDRAFSGSSDIPSCVFAHPTPLEQMGKYIGSSSYKKDRFVSIALSETLFEDEVPSTMTFEINMLAPKFWNREGHLYNGRHLELTMCNDCIPLSNYPFDFVADYDEPDGSGSSSFSFFPSDAKIPPYSGASADYGSVSKVDVPLHEYGEDVKLVMRSNSEKAGIVDEIKIKYVDLENHEFCDVKDDNEIIFYDTSSVVKPIKVIDPIDGEDTVAIKEVFFNDGDKFVSTSSCSLIFKFNIPSVDTLENAIIRLPAPKGGDSDELMVSYKVGTNWLQTPPVMSNSSHLESFHSLPDIPIIDDTLSVKIKCDTLIMIDCVEIVKNPTAATTGYLEIDKGELIISGDSRENVYTDALKQLDNSSVILNQDDSLILEISCSESSTSDYRAYFCEFEAKSHPAICANHFDVDVKNDTVRVKDEATGNPVSGAMVFINDASSTIVLTNTQGYAINSHIDLDTLTLIEIHKDDYTPYTVLPYGTLKQHQTLFGDVTFYGDVIIPDTLEVSIFPGSRIEPQPNIDLSFSGQEATKCELSVKGHLRVLGTEQDTVIFQPSSADTSREQWYGIVLNGGTADIDYSHIERSTYGIISQANNNSLELKNTQITKVHYPICSSYLNADFALENCRFTDYKFNGINFNGINSSTISLKNCQINGGQMNIYLAENDAEIWDCTLKNADFGIFFDNSVSGTASSLSLHRTLIDSSDVGIMTYLAGIVWLGDTISPDSLLGNAIHNCSSYYIRNLTKTDTIMAQNVFWDDSTAPSSGKFLADYGAPIIYTPWAGYNAHDCRSTVVHCVPCEYPTIDSALTVAVDDDTIYIFKGTFEERGLVVNEQIVIDGSGVDSTIISGEALSPRIFTTNSLANTDTIWASNFTVSAGYDSTINTSTGGGGGWFVAPTNGALMLDNIRFESCTTFYSGGAVRGYQSNIRINNCIFDNNYGQAAGAVETRQKSGGLIVENSLVRNNRANSYGGSVKAYYSGNLEFYNNVFANNTAGNWSGGLDLRGSGGCKIMNNTFYGNYGANRGGAITHTRSSSATWLNNIFYEDSSTSGDELYLENTTYHLLYCNIDTSKIQGDSYVNTYRENIDTIPEFIDPLNYDFRLMSSSSLIDAGKDTLEAPSTDILGTDRDASGLDYDIGAYEYPEGGYSREFWETDKDIALPRIAEIDRIMPNPFNSTVTIEFSTKSEDHIQIDIFSTDGRCVRILVSESFIEGNYTRMWDGTDMQGNSLESGVYLVRLKYGDSIADKKTVTLIK